MYEEQLTRIKRKIEGMFQEGEIPESHLYKATHELLKEEGISENEYRSNTIYNAVVVTDGILKKMPIEKHRGIKEDYLTLKGERLSPEAQDDVREYSDLEEKVKNHMKEQFGENVVYPKQLLEELEDYLYKERHISKRDFDLEYFKIAHKVCPSLTGILNIKNDPPGEKEIKMKKLRESLANI